MSGEKDRPYFSNTISQTGGAVRAISNKLPNFFSLHYELSHRGQRAKRLYALLKELLRSLPVNPAVGALPATTALKTMHVATVIEPGVSGGCIGGTVGGTDLLERANLLLTIEKHARNLLKNSLWV